jgi:tetratricopeptide (TPR) repeat protein
MNNVDLFIKYLSGDMNPEDAGSFEERLSSDRTFKEHFEETSTAFELIRDQLQKRDLDNFKEILSEVMEGSGSEKSDKRPGFRSWWYLPLLLAGSLAILLVILRSNPDENRTFSRYYHPGEDPVLLAYNQSTRGQTESGILYFQLGQYSKSMEMLSELISMDQENLLAQLYYLLGSIETGMQDKALERLTPLDLKTDHQLGQAIYWYGALAFIQTGRYEEANELLLPLMNQQGPYQSDARRLQKNLLK